MKGTRSSVAVRKPEREASSYLSNIQRVWVVAREQNVMGQQFKCFKNHLEQNPPVLDGVKPGKEGLLRPGSNTGGMPWSAGYAVGRLRA